MQEPRYPTIHYASCLLRLRWTRQDGALTCQAMLQNVASQEQHYFPDLESLVAYLKEYINAEPGEGSLPSA
jgi:hypothetical protein